MPARQRLLTLLLWLFALVTGGLASIEVVYRRTRGVSVLTVIQALDPSLLAAYALSVLVVVWLTVRLVDILVYP